MASSAGGAYLIDVKSNPCIFDVLGGFRFQNPAAQRDGWHAKC